MKKELRILNRKTKSGFKGIIPHKATGKFEVKLNVITNAKRHNFYIGLADTIPEAIKLRQDFIVSLL